MILFCSVNFSFAFVGYALDNLSTLCVVVCNQIFSTFFLGTLMI